MLHYFRLTILLLIILALLGCSSSDNFNSNGSPSEILTSSAEIMKKLKSYQVDYATNTFAGSLVQDLEKRQFYSEFHGKNSELSVELFVTDEKAELFLASSKHNISYILEDLKKETNSMYFNWDILTENNVANPKVSEEGQYIIIEGEAVFDPFDLFRPMPQSLEKLDFLSVDFILKNDNSSKIKIFVDKKTGYIGKIDITGSSVDMMKKDPHSSLTIEISKFDAVNGLPVPSDF